MTAVQMALMEGSTAMLRLLLQETAQLPYTYGLVIDLFSAGEEKRALFLAHCPDIIDRISPNDLLFGKSAVFLKAYLKKNGGTFALEEWMGRMWPGVYFSHRHRCAELIRFYQYALDHITDKACRAELLMDLLIDHLDFPDSVKLTRLLTRCMQEVVLPLPSLMETMFWGNCEDVYGDIVSTLRREGRRLTVDIYDTRMSDEIYYSIVRNDPDKDGELRELLSVISPAAIKPEVDPLNREILRTGGVELVRESIDGGLINEVNAGALIRENRYLAPGIYAFAGVAEEEEESWSTDGTSIYYKPDYLLSQLGGGDIGYKKLKNGYLMMLCHCLLGHPWLPAEGGEEAIWDAACDITAKELCNELTGEREFANSNGMLTRLINLAKKLSPDVLVVLAEKAKTKRLIMQAGCRLNYDAHGRWRRKPEQPKLPGQAGEPDDKMSRLLAGMQAEKAASSKQAEAWQSVFEMIMDSVPEEVRKSLLYGHIGGDSMKAIRAANETASDYHKLLAEYSTLKERKTENPEELDYAWYTLGLDLYGNIPIVEFPEAAETPAVDDIVIAVDVSGSCDGDVARRFLRETCNIIRDMEIGFEEVNIRILECDSEIQRETVIHRAEDIPDLENRELRGFGGTSFVTNAVALVAEPVEAVEAVKAVEAPE